MEQQHYVGLDVSLETTSFCVIDHDGAVVWRGRCAAEQMPFAGSFALRHRPSREPVWRPATSPTG